MEKNYRVEKSPDGLDSKFDLGTGGDFGLYQWGEEAKTASGRGYGPNSLMPLYGGQAAFGMNSPIMDLMLKQLLVMYLMQDIGMQKSMLAGGRC